MNKNSFEKNFLFENKFEINLNELNEVYKINKIEDEKHLLLKKRKAEYARNGRKRKKIEIENLVKENKLLKEKIAFLEKELNENICNECKNKINQQNTFQILANQNQRNSKKIFFLTTISIIFLFFYFNLENNFKTPERFLRELNYFSRDNYYSLTEEYILNSTSKPKNIYIRYGDYFSIIYKKPFLNYRYYNFVNLEKIRFFHEDNLTEEMNLEEHINDMIILKDDAIQVIGPLKFNLFLNPAFVKTPDYNKTFINKRIDGNGTKSLFYEIEMIGYSRNQVLLK